jgi:hypothetical protein
LEAIELSVQLLQSLLKFVFPIPLTVDDLSWCVGKELGITEFFLHLF